MEVQATNTTPAEMEEIDDFAFDPVKEQQLDPHWLTMQHSLQMMESVGPLEFIPKPKATSH